MAVTITTADVLDGFSTSASTADLTAYIAVVDQADACLDANSVPDAIASQLKILGVRHLAQNANDGGSVIEQRAISGASRKFAERYGGYTSHLDTLRAIDQYGCVMGTLTNTANIQLRSAGRRSPV